MGTTNREGKPISGVSGCVWLPPTTNHQPPANLGAFVSTARYGGFGFGEWTSISNQLVWCELFPLEDMRMFWLCMFCYASWTCQTESFDNLHMSTSLWVLEKKCHIHDMKQGQCRKEQLHMWSLQQTNFWSQNPSTGLPSPIWPQEIPHFPHLNIVLLFISFHYIPINLLVICIRIYIYFPLSLLNQVMSPIFLETPAIAYVGRTSCDAAPCVTCVIVWKPARFRIQTCQKTAHRWCKRPHHWIGGKSMGKAHISMGKTFFMVCYRFSPKGSLPVCATHTCT
jgi:hypothetical protein